MTERYVEETVYHTRVMKCTLEIEHSRAYWQLCGQSEGPVSTETAFEKAIFGSRTLSARGRIDGGYAASFDAFRSP